MFNASSEPYTDLIAIPAVFISTRMIPFTLLDVEMDRAYKGYELALFYDAGSILTHRSHS